MALKEYRRKRHFDNTPEPGPEVSASQSGRLYIIQKHAASHLHYDFRLELDGVLKSWAVPKGPSLNPADKRLAVQVEDHPVAYGSFEGVIPEHEYGGGTVMLWDRGEWEALGVADEMYKRGRLKFRLHGEKLRGGWSLVRMARREGERENWLLVKEKDAEARFGGADAFLERNAFSVASRRAMDEIAAASDRVWTSRGESKSVKAAASRHGAGRQRRSRTLPEVNPADLKGARAAPQPDFVNPQLATLVKEIPAGNDWLHEVKFDGYRILAVIKSGRVRLMTRREQDWTDRFPAIAEALSALSIDQGILDGELVVLGPGGISSFQALQNALKDGSRVNLVYYVFDVPHFGGYDLTRSPLSERKELLRRLLEGQPGASTLRLSDHIVGQGATVLEHACHLGMEGVISKRAGSGYESARTSSWLKVKCSRRQEFVIGGFTDPSGARKSFGALLLGYNDELGRLRYCGKVGTGFDEKSLAMMYRQMAPLETAKTPFFDPPRGAEARGAHWIKPKLVAEVEFTEWTHDNHLRHPSFQGLREDKVASEVIREVPQPMANVKNNGVRRAGHKLRSRLTPVTAHRTVAGVSLTHPERVLYPQQGLTKGELAEYYEQVAEWILPHVVHRPLMLVRCPEGQGSECFHQKHPGQHTPAALRTIPVVEKNKTESYFVLDDLAGLIALVQMGVMEIHVWGSPEQDIERPDRLIFDLDPGPQVAWEQVVEAARLTHEVLKGMKLESFVKTTGGKGLHVVAPLEPHADWAQVKAFARDTALAISRDQPKKYLAVMTKSKRTGKTFIDYLRNGRGATAVVAYSTRARPGAPVSMPLRWNELGKIAGADQFTVRNAVRRLKALKSDPWKGFQDVRQRLPV